MAYLNKRQYDYRRESAAARNLNNEEIAVQNGMTSDQAELISPSSVLSVTISTAILTALSKVATITQSLMR